MNAYWLSLTKMKTHGVVNRTLTFGLYYSDTAHYNSTGKHTKSFPSDGIWANQGRFISSTISYGPEPWPGATASPTEHDHYLGHTHMHPNKMCTQTHTLEHFLNAVLVPYHWQSCNARRHRDRQRSSPWPKNSLLHQSVSWQAWEIRRWHKRLRCMRAPIRQQK